LTFRAWAPGVEMAVDRHGLPIPARGEAVVPEVLLVPVNVFDGEGFRLGYGGGYFDRTLEAMPATAVGVGFELARAQTAHPRAPPRRSRAERAQPRNMR